MQFSARTPLRKQTSSIPSKQTYNPSAYPKQHQSASHWSHRREIKKIDHQPCYFTDTGSKCSGSFDKPWSRATTGTRLSRRHRAKRDRRAGVNITYARAVTAFSRSDRQSRGLDQLCSAGLGAGDSSRPPPTFETRARAGNAGYPPRWLVAMRALETDISLDETGRSRSEPGCGRGGDRRAHVAPCFPWFERSLQAWWSFDMNLPGLETSLGSELIKNRPMCIRDCSRDCFILQQDFYARTQLWISMY